MESQDFTQAQDIELTEADLADIQGGALGSYFFDYFPIGTPADIWKKFGLKPQVPDIVVQNPLKF